MIIETDGAIAEAVEAGEFRQGVGTCELVAIRESLVKLDVQRGVAVIGAAFRDADDALRALRLRIKGLSAGAERDDRVGSWIATPGNRINGADAQIGRAHV